MNKGTAEINFYISKDKKKWLVKCATLKIVSSQVYFIAWFICAVTPVLIKMTSKALKINVIFCFLHRIWYNEMVETVDCGDIAANWLSKYVLNRDCGVRLGYYLPDVMGRRAADEKLKQCFKTLKNKDLVIVKQFMQYMQFLSYNREK
jgi:hypothetical protein